MNRSEASKYFNSLLVKTYDDYCRKNRYEIENIKKNQMKKDVLIIPKIGEHELMLINNYDLKQLKEIIKYYGLKLTGKKEMLIARIFSYLYLSKYSLKLQKVCHRFISKKYIRSHGPAYFNRSLCVNSVDFLTMDEMKDITPSQFFSYKDKHSFVYGFDVVSLHNLIKQSGNDATLNPFTKSRIHPKVIRRFRKMIYLSNLLNISINLKIEDECPAPVMKSSLNETKLLFQYIDQLGNYTNANWFLNLSKIDLLNFIVELFNIWNYRSELSDSTKIKICSPTGNPFYNENINNQPFLQYLTQIPDIENLRLEILDVLNKFVKKGLSEEYNKLGAYFVLGALTLVSVDAENSLPWLYESFSYN